MDTTRTRVAARPSRNGTGGEDARVLLGQVTAADSEKGVTVHLRRGQSLRQHRRRAA